MKKYNKENRKLRDVKASLRKSGVRPSRTKGQNFLLDENVLAGIVEFAEPDFSQKIVEIGPGLGALTKYLAPAENLTLIELESEFCRELEKSFPNARIINEDIRQVDFSEIGENLVVFGNIPYVYSTDIIFRLIDNSKRISKAVLLMQKEFARRLAAPSGGREYGAISIAVQLWADIKLGSVVKGDAFHPATKVDSQVVSLQFLSEPRYPIEDYAAFRRLVKAAFMQRRKKLINSLKASGFYTSIDLPAVLEACGISGSRRAETLSIIEFVDLSQKIREVS